MKVKPLKKVGKIGTAVTIEAAIADIHNTWSANNGNTNLKRIEKTGIQVAGIVALGAVGGVTGSMIGTGVAGAGETGGGSLVLIPLAGAIDYKAAEKIDKIQDKLYKKLEIK